MDEQREREVKLDVPSGWRMPELDSLVPAGGHELVATVRLSSSYFDTAAHDLLANELTLRRRTGDHDQGWQLKLTEEGARTEVRLPLNGRGVPGDLREMLRGVHAGAALRRIARLDTERTIHRIVAANGSVLGEVVDDHVSASVTGPVAVLSEWREVEVEVERVDGAEEFLAAACRRLRKSGARRAEVSSKLARAVGDPHDECVAADSETVGALVRSYLHVQRSAIIRGDLDLRRGRDVVHPTRVAVRRYRSVLRIVDVFDADRAAALDAELAWYADMLGTVRDRQVLRSHLRKLVATLSDEVGAVSAAARIEAALDREQELGRAALVQALSGRRYLALLRELRAWHDNPPFTANAERPADQVDHDVRSACRKLTKRLDRARRGRRDDADLHRARKAAKRARYVAELAEPVLGKKARRTVKRLKRLQDRLGLHQDSVVARDFVARLAAVPTGDGSDFTLGVLWQRERDRAESTRSPA